MATNVVKIATYNVNGVVGRLPMLLRWLADDAPDIVCHAGYDLSSQIKILWLEDGDHDLKPRKTIYGYSAAAHLKAMSEATAAWANRI